MKDFQFEPNMTFKEAGQLEIKKKPEEFPNDDQKETLEIETIEIKDENRHEKDFQFEPKMIYFKEAGQLEIKNNPEEFPNNDEKETLEIESIEIKDELSHAMKDFQFEPKMTFKEAGQLEIQNKLDEFPNYDQKEIETTEMKDENSYEMEVQEDFELQLESDSDDDMNDNEIEPPTMENKDDGKHFLGCSNHVRLRSLIILCVYCSGVRSY